MFKKKSFIITGLIVVFLISCGKKGETTSPKAPPLKNVKIETVKRSSIEDEYEAVGTVRSRTTSVLSSKNVGTIIAVHVREGDRVRSGQLLIKVDDRDARAQLQKAEAGLREAQEGLEEIDHTIRAAQSAVEVAEANKHLALSTFHRYKNLLEFRSISQQQFDEVQAKAKVSEAEAERAIRTLQAYMARKNQFMAKIDQAKADLSSAQVYLSYSRITSPVNGIVTAKQVDVGALAVPGAPLLTIEDDSHYQFEASVDESRVRSIRVGDPVRVQVNALGQGEITSRVTEIVPALDPSSRSYIAKIDLPGAKGDTGSQTVLRSGLFGKGHFVMGQKEASLVPRKAILERGQLVGVYVVDSSRIVRLQLITTGKSYGDAVEVLSGINDGDQIVAEVREGLKEGVRIE